MIGRGCNSLPLCFGIGLKMGAVGTVGNAWLYSEASDTSAMFVKGRLTRKKPPGGFEPRNNY